MKNIKLLLSLIFLTLFSFKVNSAGTGEATEYKITMTKLELCETGSAAATCLNPVTISPAADSGAVDIAAVTAGAAAAAYGNLNTATVGATYTYLQITMSRLITIKGTASDGCHTSGGTAGGVNAYAVGASGAAVVPQVVTVPNTNSMSGSVGANINGAADALGASVSASTAISDTDTHFQYRQELSKPAIIKAGQIPNVTITFDTSTALGSIEGSGGLACTGAVMYAAEPSITVTID